MIKELSSARSWHPGLVTVLTGSPAAGGHWLNGFVGHTPQIAIRVSRVGADENGRGRLESEGFRRQDSRRGR